MLFVETFLPKAWGKILLPRYLHASDGFHETTEADTAVSMRPLKRIQ
jgi:hypothetical protein